MSQVAVPKSASQVADVIRASRPISDTPVATPPLSAVKSARNGRVAKPVRGMATSSAVANTSGHHRCSNKVSAIATPHPMTIKMLNVMVIGTLPIERNSSRP